VRERKMERVPWRWERRRGDGVLLLLWCLREEMRGRG
jgi:hypothetical protein